MRRVFVVLVLLAVMAGLKTLKTESVGAADPMTLAAIGFVVLAAFAIAELGADFTLPKVTGYIVSGVLLGPQVTNVLSSTVVEEMRMFSTLALGLIATTAGLELDLPTLRRLAKTLLATVLAKIVLGVAVVGGLLVVLELSFDILGLGDTNTALGLGLIFAALSLGTSPSIAIAIIEETRAKGRISDLVLGAAVLKDVVVVVCLAVAISTARVLTQGGSLEIDLFVSVGKELGTSLAAGAVLGGLFIVYMRFIRAEMLLFVAASILVTAEISAALHLELLLVFIVAGFVVRNFSPYEHDLLRALQTVSLPVFIVFFTNAGAGVDLRTTWSLLPLALALCAARIVSYVLASRFGAWAGGETPAVSRLAWLGYLPQAGVSLGLVGLASAQLPDLATPIASLGMAVVAINLLAGPLTLRVALRRHGELPGDQPGDTAASSAAAPAVSEAPAGPLDNPALAGYLADAVQATRQQLDELEVAVLGTWLDAWTERFATKPDDSGDGRARSLARLEGIVERIEADEGEARRILFARTYDRIAGALASLPEVLEVPLEPALAQVQAEDAIGPRWRKRLATIGAALRGRSRRRTRTVPVALAVRAAFDLRLAELLESLSRAWQRYEIETLELIHQAAIGTRDTDLLPSVERCTAAFRDDWRERIEHALARGTASASHSLAELGAPATPSNALRYSTVEADVREALERNGLDNEAWDGVRRAALNLLSTTVGVQLARARLAETLRNTVTDPGDDVFQALGEELEAELTRLDKVLSEVSGSSEIALDDDGWARLSMAADALLPKPAHKRLRSVANKLRSVTASRTVAAAVDEFVAGGEGIVTMLPSLQMVRTLERPASVNLSSINVAELHQVKLAGSLMPKLEASLEATSRHFAFVRHEMSECAQLAHFVVENAHKDSDEDSVAELRRSLASGLSHVRERLLVLTEICAPRWQEQRDALTNLVDDTGNELLDALFAVTGAPSVRSQVHARLQDVAFVARLLFAYERGKHRVQTVVELVRRWLIDSWHTRATSDPEFARIAGGINAAAIRRHLDQRHALDIDNALPSLYPPLFAIDTLRDPRFFAVHRDALRIVVDAERAWRSDSSHGNAVLVTGSSGSGRSSLLATAELKLGTRRVAALRPRNAGDPADWKEALARELGSPRHGFDHLAHALSRGKGLVVIDDLHTWFPPTLSGVAELERWLELVVATSSNTLWVVTCFDETWDLLEAVTQIRSVFTDVARLSPLGPQTLGAVLASRQNLSGLGVVYPQTLWSRWLPRWRRASPQAEYLRRLCAASGGNMRRALSLWLHHARAGEGNLVYMQPIADISPGLPFIRQLDTVQLAALSALLRHGALTMDVLTELLGEDGKAVEQHLHFLHAAGLVAREQDERIAYYVPSPVSDELCHAMISVGAFGERKALA